MPNPTATISLERTTSLLTAAAELGHEAGAPPCELNPVHEALVAGLDGALTGRQKLQAFAALVALAVRGGMRCPYSFSDPAVMQFLPLDKVDDARVSRLYQQIVAGAGPSVSEFRRALLSSLLTGLVDRGAWRAGQELAKLVVVLAIKQNDADLFDSTMQYCIAKDLMALDTARHSLTVYNPAPCIQTHYAWGFVYADN